MAIDDLPEKTRRHLELEYSFNAYPDENTTSALAQLTGLATEEVSNWFETKRQKDQPPLSSLSSQGVTDQEKPRDPTTDHSEGRQRPKFGKSNESSKEVEVGGQDQGHPSLQRLVNFDKVLEGFLLERDIGPIVLPGIREYPPRQLDFGSTSANTSVPDCNIVSTTSTAINGKNSEAAAEVDHSSDGITDDDDDESSFPGFFTFSASNDKLKEPRRRRRFHLQRRREVAQVRRVGACAECKARKVRVSQPTVSIELLEFSYRFTVPACPL
jgi:hypothetical protein